MSLNLSGVPTINADPKFSCPLSCLAGAAEVFGGTQYGWLAKFRHANPVILDIGANVGCFTVWAQMVWPGGVIHAYEPNPVTFDYLKTNTYPMPCDSLVRYNAAVGDPANNKLFKGRNPLCDSQYTGVLGDQTPEALDIQVIRPEDLPKADILKIDTEGAEVYILSHLQFFPTLIAVEWHSDALRMEVEGILGSRYTLVYSHVNHPGCGVFGFVRSS